MKKIIFSIIILLTPFLILGQQFCPIYQKSIKDFILNEWNELFFEGECTRLKFEKKAYIEVNIDQPLTYVDRDVVANFFDSDLLIFITKSNLSQQVFDSIHNNDSIFNANCMDLSAYRVLVKSNRLEPSKKHEYPNYFMRISNLFFWNSYIYVSFWIKKSKYTSGVHIIYQFDTNFNLLKKKSYHLCDENN